MKRLTSVFALTVWCATMVAPSFGVMVYTGTPLFENFNSLPASSISGTGGTPPFPAADGVPNAIPGIDWVATRLDGTGTAGTMSYTAWTELTSTSTGAIIGARTSTSPSERALGTLTSGSFRPAIGVEIRNDSPSALKEVTISFDQENWRRPGPGGTPTVNGVINITLAQYGTTASGITSSTIFTAPLGNWSVATALNLESAPAAVDGSGNQLAAVATNGNDLSNTFVRMATIDFSSDPIGIGESFFLRFMDVDNAGSDAITAIDRFSFSAVAIPEPSAFFIVGMVGLGSAGLAFVRAWTRG